MRSSSLRRLLADRTNQGKATPAWFDDLVEWQEEREIPEFVQAELSASRQDQIERDWCLVSV